MIYIDDCACFLAKWSLDDSCCTAGVSKTMALIILAKKNKAASKKFIKQDGSTIIGIIIFPLFRTVFHEVP